MFLILIILKTYPNDNIIFDIFLLTDKYEIECYLRNVNNNPDWCPFSDDLGNKIFSNVND